MMLVFAIVPIMKASSLTRDVGLLRVYEVEKLWLSRGSNSIITESSFYKAKSSISTSSTQFYEAFYAAGTYSVDVSSWVETCSGFNRVSVWDKVYGSSSLFVICLFLCTLHTVSVELEQVDYYPLIIRCWEWDPVMIFVTSWLSVVSTSSQLRWPTSLIEMCCRF